MIEEILAKLTDVEVLHMWEEGVGGAIGPGLEHRAKLTLAEIIYLDAVNSGVGNTEEFQLAIEKRLGVKFDEDGYVIDPNADEDDEVSPVDESRNQEDL